MISFTFRSVAAFVLAFGMCSGLAAQELISEYPTSNRDEEGNIVRAGYITNEWHDNWTISLGGGINTLTAKNNTMMVSPEFEFNVTKWAMPAMGFRIGVQGFQGKEKYVPDFRHHSCLPYKDGVVSWDYFYAHADMLWNATNSFLGYKYDRIWSVIPYLHGGYMRLFDPEAYSENYDNEAVFGAGVLNTIRLTDRLGLTVDLRAGNFSGRFHTFTQGQRATNLTAAVGIALNIPKLGWRRVREIENAGAAAAAAREAALASLASAQKDNDALRARNQNLMDEMNALKKLAAEEVKARPYIDDELLRRIAEAPLVIYYDINVDTIRDCEQLHINDYVKSVLDEDSKHVFYITGSADKGTGTESINNRLSNGRVNNVKDYLINTLKVPASQVVIKNAIISDEHADARLDRCVLFENN